MERPDRGRGRSEKGKEEAGAEPVDGAGGCGEEVGGRVGDGGVGEPLWEMRLLAAIRTRLSVRKYQVNAILTSQLMTIFSKINCVRPNHLIL